MAIKVQSNHQIGDTITPLACYCVDPLEYGREYKVIGTNPVKATGEQEVRLEGIKNNELNGSVSGWCGWCGWRFRSVRKASDAKPRSYSEWLDKNFPGHKNHPAYKAGNQDAEDFKKNFLGIDSPFSSSPKTVRDAAKKSAQRLLKALRTNLNWKYGQIVEYIGTDASLRGREYTFLGYNNTDDNFIFLKDILGFYPIVDFRLKNNKQKPKKPMYHNYRDKIGRFAPRTHAQLVANITAAAAKASDIPTKLRPGAIYRIAGGPVARLKGTVKDAGVFSVHGKLLAFNTNRVRFADRDDVEAYLADSAAEHDRLSKAIA